MSKIKDYFTETKLELKHVNWPTRVQTIYYTIIVAVLSVGLAYILGFFDFLFSKGLEKVISL
ncbi:MAG: preprotein translocase subunit SecE [Candidatus Nomurabacteria bacterium]|nr:preprotein translocase subunit SecE [Candidatus Nomurabacteria bacterium]